MGKVPHLISDVTTVKYQKPSMFVLTQILTFLIIYNSLEKRTDSDPRWPGRYVTLNIRIPSVHDEDIMIDTNAMSVHWFILSLLH